MRKNMQINKTFYLTLLIIILTVQNIFATNYDLLFNNFENHYHIQQTYSEILNSDSEIIKYLINNLDSNQKVHWIFAFDTTIFEYRIYSSSSHPSSYIDNIMIKKYAASILICKYMEYHYLNYLNPNNKKQNEDSVDLKNLRCISLQKIITKYIRKPLIMKDCFMQYYQKIKLSPQNINEISWQYYQKMNRILEE